MEFFKTKGIIIREVEFSEADKILTILTDDLGLITAKANGIKSMKRKELSGAKLFIYGDYILTKKGDFYNLRECNIITFFSNIKDNIESLALGYYILEVSGNMASVNEFEPDILRLTLNTLFALNQNKLNTNILKGAFEMKVSSQLGYAPQTKQQDEISQQSGSAEKIKTLPVKYFFDLLNGIVFDENSQNEMTRNVVPISIPILKSIDYIINSDLKNYLSFTLKEEYIKDFSEICEKFFLLHSGFVPKSLDYMKKIIDL